jgi:cardiolipin synthase (CMP-forming)
LGHYRASDLLLPPSLVSLTRLPLAVAFALLVEQPLFAVLVLIAAGASDVLDGWLARTRGQATATGAVIDPITDKLFVGSVVVSLIDADRLTLSAVPLLAARELGELPLVAWWAVSHSKRTSRSEHPIANVPGKLATAMQFVAITAALFQSPWTGALLIATGAAGALAALSYIARELRPRKR